MPASHSSASVPVSISTSDSSARLYPSGISVSNNGAVIKGDTCSNGMFELYPPLGITNNMQCPQVHTTYNFGIAMPSWECPVILLFVECTLQVSDFRYATAVWSTGVGWVLDNNSDRQYCVVGQYRRELIHRLMATTTTDCFSAAPITIFLSSTDTLSDKKISSFQHFWPVVSWEQKSGILKGRHTSLSYSARMCHIIRFNVIV